MRELDDVFEPERQKRLRAELVQLGLQRVVHHAPVTMATGVWRCSSDVRRR